MTEGGGNGNVNSRHCEEHRDEAIQSLTEIPWIAALPSVARNDEEFRNVITRFMRVIH